MPSSPTPPQVVTAHALKLALSPDWSEVEAAKHLVELVGGSELALRRSLARLDHALLERQSAIVERATRSLRAGLSHVIRDIRDAAG